MVQSIMASRLPSKILAFFALIIVVLQAVACERIMHPPLEPFTAITMKPSPLTKDALHIRFFGTTTIQIDDGETAIMIDGFLSRPGFGRVGLSKVAPAIFSIEPDKKRITDALKEGKVGKLAAVLVSHSHYDHALDSAVVACQQNAILVGSESTAFIGQGHELPEKQIHIARVDETLTIKRFTVDVFKSPHSPSYYFPGEITEKLTRPAPVRDYKEGGKEGDKEGGSYSFLIRHEWGTVLIHPSANFVSGMFRGVEADVVFLSIAQLGEQSDDFAKKYWHEVIDATHPKLVIPIHWDDFFRPLNQPLLPMLRMGDKVTLGLDRVVKMAGESKIPIHILPKFEAFDVIFKHEEPYRQARLTTRPKRPLRETTGSSGWCVSENE